MRDDSSVLVLFKKVILKWVAVSGFWEEQVPDSDDDRKMRQAEQRAIMKKEAKKRPPRVYNNPVTGPVQRQYYEQQKGQNFRPYRQNQLGFKTGFQQFQNSSRFSCHFCGQPGHLKATCPHRQGFIQPFNPFIQPTHTY